MHSLPAIFLAAGDKVFSNFSYNPNAGNLAGPAANNVQVSVVPGGGNDPRSGPDVQLHDPELRPFRVWRGTKDVIIGFTVMAPAGVIISGATLKPCNRI
jgi:hypothetical protein